MPCTKNLALAFNHITAALKLQHSSASAGVPTALAPSIVGAVGFSLIMAFVTVQILKSRAWFLWALSTASILQCAGFIASAIHTHDGSNHLAFLASFATINFAPILLSIAIFTTFDRLRQTVMPESAQQAPWVYFSRRLGTFILIPCLVPVAMFACAIVNIGKFLSPLPIDGRNAAFMRLLNYEIGINQLEKAYASQAILCVVFGVFISVFTAKSKSWEVTSMTVRNKNWRELLHIISIVNGLVCLRACCKVYECREIAASRSALGDNGILFWMFDVLPMLTALVTFCGVKPASYLPEMTGRIMLDPEAPYAHEKVSDHSAVPF